MSTQQRGLGRGIDSLFRNSSEGYGAQSNQELIPLSCLFARSDQPRKTFDDASLEELALSIRQQGVLQPLLVRPLAKTKPQQYEVIAGERRLRAAKLAELSTVPVIIRELSDEDVAIVSLVENLQREDLHPVEEAMAMKELRDSLSLSQEELAMRLGKSRSAVANTLRLLQLPASLLDALRIGSLTAGHARALLAITNATLQQQVFDRIIKEELSVREAEALATYIKNNGDLPSERPGATGKKASRSAKAESVKVAQSLLQSGIHAGATVTGSGEKGKISIPYDSAEDLNDLLRRLGLNV